MSLPFVDSEPDNYHLVLVLVIRHLCPGRVKLTRVSVSVISTGVWILRLSDHPQERGVGVGQGTHTAQTAPSAATVKRVK